MSIFVSLVILVLVVVFMLLAFALAVTFVGWGLRERETEWPENWNAPTAELGPQGVAREEREETAAGAHHVA